MINVASIALTALIKATVDTLSTLAFLYVGVDATISIWHLAVGIPASVAVATRDWHAKVCSHDEVAVVVHAESGDGIVPLPPVLLSLVRASSDAKKVVPL
jgi:hypothetical protein